MSSHGKSLMIVALGALFAASGCDRRDNQRDDITGMRSEPERPGVGMDPRGAADNQWETERNAFGATLTSRLQVLDARIDALDDRIDDIDVDTKKDFDEALDRIEERRDDLKDRVDGLRDVKREQFDTWRTDVNRRFEGIQADLNKLEQQVRTPRPS